MAWTKSQVIKLIELIRERPSLYDPQHIKYKSRFARQEMLMECQNGIQPIRENTSIEDIKKKWSAIRQTYLLEKRKEENCGKSGTPPDMVYRPSLFYYQEMAFLKDSVEARPSQLTHEEADSHEESFVTSPRNLVREETGPSTGEPLSALINNSSRKRKRMELGDTGSLRLVSEALLSASSSLQAFGSTELAEDNEDRYAKTVADRLRTFSERDRVLIKRQIDDFFFQKYMEKKGD